MIERRIKWGVALLVAACLLLAAWVALADREDAAEMAAYWNLVGDVTGTDPLTRAMNGEYAALSDAEKADALDALKAVTEDELLSFAARNRLPIAMARHGYYAALAQCLAGQLAASGESPLEQTLALFLAMAQNSRDSAANAERRSIRKTLTEATIEQYASQSGLPAGFLAWLLLDDEWHEEDWEDGDDWLEGRRSWTLSGWVDASDLRAQYGADAVVTEDEVERVLRQNGLRFDD